MGYNSPKFDVKKHLNAKSVKQLEELKVYLEERIAEFKTSQLYIASHDKLLNEYLWLVKLEIAERIGK